ncbi:hypothetical protein HNP92_001159 [Methanococcus maripaludis]|uniref:Uncharacterized protein n=1 Tax=Methanococcus maripaludis TaxID=39152 RepID=A0A7J9S7M1_METMI|nr:hypothetical protein [Methanococcus maripaludis]MBB6401854.1 hypothetical protein [Methanococcus maripaludis]
MIQEKSSIFKSISWILILFLLFSSSNALELNDLSVSSTHTEVSKSFSINKVEDYTYILSYNRYGTLNETIVANIYLNGQMIAMHGEGSQRNDFSKDITNILKDGENSLKIVSEIPPTYTVSFKIRDIQISEPTPIINLPISPNVDFLAFILCLIFLMKKKW